jgi:glycerol-3-phosphate cytidylyltransferase
MKIGFVASAFDLCHAGHLVMLKEARENCDYLICALHVNPKLERPEKNKPIETSSERYIRLRGLSYVDEVIPYETEDELYQLLLLLKPNIRFLGSDYVGEEFTGKGLSHIEIHYCERLHNVSTSNLRSKIIASLS